MGAGVSFFQTKRFSQSFEMRIEWVQESEGLVDGNDPLAEEEAACRPKAHPLTKAGWMTN